MISANEISATLCSMSNDAERRNLSRFFKTGEGEYGAGDTFLGIRVPQVRAVVKQARRQVELCEIEKLLNSPYHEVRLCGFLLTVEEMRSALPCRGVDTPGKASHRDEIARFYLCNAHHADNWDLVDLSCYKILGLWLLHPLANGLMPDRSILDELARSTNMWEQRIAIVTTMMLIRHRQYADTLRIATTLLGHNHDLIHKAIGWMLREVWKRDPEVIESYLESHYRDMHRTTLRYAIERMPQQRRQSWLQRR